MKIRGTHRLRWPYREYNERKRANKSKWETAETPWSRKGAKADCSVRQLRNFERTVHYFFMGVVASLQIQASQIQW